MNDDLDLCVKKRGEWSLYQIYPAQNRKEAMKDAGYLKTSGDFDAVMLLDDSNNKVLFSYTARRGPPPTFRDVRRGLNASSSRGMTSKGFTGAKPMAAAPARIARQPASSGTMLSKEGQIALQIGVGGFILTVLTLLIMGTNDAAFVTMALTFVLMGSLTLGATAGIYSLLEQNTPARQEATTQLASQKKLQKTEEVFTDAFVIGKNKVWDRESQSFRNEGHFALILYMLGMSQGFKGTMDLDTDATTKQIASLFSTVGVAPESIISCAGNLPEYLAYPQYNAVYQRGLADANNLAANPDYRINLESVLAAWADPTAATSPATRAEPEDTPQQQEQEQTNENEQETELPIAEEMPESNFALVMFTDIVGSTESIRRLGDKWMVDVLQAHNSIVREAISAFGGHEVKHTGDGIMMSFPAVERGVKASIAIQKGVSRFNREVPNRAFPLRIGMSAGEPMRLEGDLFGLPVNLAARVMPYADAFEIAMSETCHQLCTDLPYTFTSKKDCNFKGFDEPQTVYFLQWQDEKTPEADAPGVVSEPA